MPKAAAVTHKKRVSVGAKKKAKKAAQAPQPDPQEDSSDESQEEVLPATTKAAAEAEVDDAIEEVTGDAAPAVKRKTKANRLAEMEAADSDAEPRGVIYLGHLPDGFFEPQLKKFFAQFGKITRMRLCRSRKNAKSKGYAFIEFEEEGVAKIVADTMNKYLLFGKVLVCHVVPREKQHPSLFKGHRTKMLNLSNLRRKNNREDHNDRPTAMVDGVEVPRVTMTQVVRGNKRKKKLESVLANLGVKYDLNLTEGGDDSEDEKEAAPKKAQGAKKPMKKKRKTAAA